MDSFCIQDKVNRMGVTLHLRMIDHDLIVERGIPVVNAALATGDATLLMRYLLDVPFTPNSEAVAFREARCDQLRKLNAPEMIIEHEERMLRFVNGDAYSASELAKMNLDELRELLGTWGWAENSLNLDKGAYELDWFLQPAEGHDDRFLMYPIRPSPGDPTQTHFDWALMGSQQPPCDNCGMPIVRTCGSPDCSGYNSPEAVAAINIALSAVDDQKWSELVPQRIKQYRRASPELADQLEDIVTRELEYARNAFVIMRSAYTLANQRGFGIACEYTV